MFPLWGWTMPTLRKGIDSTSRVAEPPTLEALLVIAQRHSGRCYVCRWILANQGCRSDLLNPLPIAGVTISAESQQRHLESHLEARPDVVVTNANG